MVFTLVALALVGIVAAGFLLSPFSQLFRSSPQQGIAHAVASAQTVPGALPTPTTASSSHATPGPSPKPIPVASPRPTPASSPQLTPSPSPPPAPGGNLVQNPGFESGTLAAWNCSASDQVVTGNAHSGTYALQARATSTDVAQCSQTIQVQPQHTYTLQADVRGNYAYLGIMGKSNNIWTSSRTYTLLSMKFTTGPATSAVTIYVQGWYGHGTVYVDDVSLS